MCVSLLFEAAIDALGFVRFHYDFCLYNWEICSIWMNTKCQSSDLFDVKNKVAYNTQIHPMLGLDVGVYT